MVPDGVEPFVPDMLDVLLDDEAAGWFVPDGFDVEPLVPDMPDEEADGALVSDGWLDEDVEPFVPDIPDVLVDDELPLMLSAATVCESS